MSPALKQLYPPGCPDPDWCGGNNACYWRCTAPPDIDSEYDGDADARGSWREAISAIRKRLLTTIKNRPTEIQPPPSGGFDFSEVPKPNAFIQWKATKACMDFSCLCGANCHFDGYFAYTVKCPRCGVTWQMPHHLFPRPVDELTDLYWRDHPKLLEESDEDDG